MSTLIISPEAERPTIQTIRVIPESGFDKYGRPIIDALKIILEGPEELKERLCLPTTATPDEVVVKKRSLKRQVEIQAPIVLSQAPSIIDTLPIF